MNSPEFVRIMNAQKRWQLRRTHASVAGGYAGYYDMVTSFMVHTAVAQAYKDAQVKEYRFIAVIDDVTTTTCKGLNGQTFRMSDMKMGINFPAHLPAAASMQKHYRADQIGGINVQVLLGKTAMK